MPTIKEAFIELADRNTTLIHLGSAPPAGPLGLATESEYGKLYQRIAASPADYDDLAGRTGAVLGRLKPAYHGNKYWHYYYSNPNVETYSDTAWARLVPIEVRPKPRLTASPGGIAKVKVSPVPRILLHPFGWATWISLRITGEHTLPELAGLVQRFLHEPAYTLSDGWQGQTCAEVFEAIGKGVLADAFGGGKKMANSSPEVLSVTTVLDKYNGAPALGALEPEEKSALAALISDEPPEGSFPAEIVHGLSQGGVNQGNIDYALQKGSAVFIWAYHRLKSVDRNRQRLHCYHNNTFLSLVHAWKLVAFLNLAATSKDRPPALEELASAALFQIDQQLSKEDGYRNV